MLSPDLLSGSGQNEKPFRVSVSCLVSSCRCRRSSSWSFEPPLLLLLVAAFKVRSMSLYPYGYPIEAALLNHRNGCYLSFMSLTSSYLKRCRARKLQSPKMKVQAAISSALFPGLSLDAATMSPGSAETSV